MSEKPICYLDLGGVVFYDPVEDFLFHKTPHTREIRPHTIYLLKTIHDYDFELRFLTGEPDGGAGLIHLLNSAFKEEFPKWDFFEMTLKLGKVRHFASKCNYVARYSPTGNFIWLEDCLTATDSAWLQHMGYEKKFWQVNPFDRDAFLMATVFIKDQVREIAEKAAKAGSTGEAAPQPELEGASPDQEQPAG